MRVSIDPSDHGYNMRCIGATVYLDGVRMDRVAITADEERGVVVALKRGPKGYVLNASRTEIEREELRGAVRVDLPARFWLS